jgi:stage V sporulation protein K
LRRIFDGAVRGEGFGNARFARTLFEQALNTQALRLAADRIDELGIAELNRDPGARPHRRRASYR